MDFPRYVFTVEGDQECTLGTYGIAIVEDKDEFNAAIKAGYKETVTDLFKEEIEEKEAAKKPFKKAVILEKKPKLELVTEEDDF